MSGCRVAKKQSGIRANLPRNKIFFLQDAARKRDEAGEPSSPLRRELFFGIGQEKLQPFRQQRRQACGERRVQSERAVITHRGSGLMGCQSARRFGLVGNRATPPLEPKRRGGLRPSRRTPHIGSVPVRAVFTHRGSGLMGCQSARRFGLVGNRATPSLEPKRRGGLRPSRRTPYIGSRKHGVRWQAKRDTALARWVKQRRTISLSPYPKCPAGGMGEAKAPRPAVRFFGSPHQGHHAFQMAGVGEQVEGLDVAEGISRGAELFEVAHLGGGVA